MKNLTENTYVSIGLVVTIFAALISFIWHNVAITTKLSQEVSQHINDPALHHNIIEMIQRNYVTRPEIDSRLSGLREDIAEIKVILKDIAKSLNN